MGTLSYTENAGPIAIHSTVNLSDFDSTHLVGATVQFASGFSASQDILAFTNQLGITGSYNSSTGVLTLTGTAHSRLSDRTAFDHLHEFQRIANQLTND